MEKQPLVTVFMAMYNGEKYVAAAINSALNQSLQDFELLIIDDGSKDNSYQVVKAFTDPRIRVLQNEQNIGLYRTRSRGVAEARGRYFAILDCDDLANAERLSAPVNFLEQHPDHAACFGLSDFIDSDDRPLPSQPMEAGAHAWVDTLSFFYNPFINSTLVMRTDILRQYDYRAGYEPTEDYDLMQRVIADHHVAILPQKLIRYRLHQQNSSNVQSEKGILGNKRVYAELLKGIGLEGTTEQTDLHDTLYRKTLAGTGYTLNDIESWLLKLRHQPQKRYNTDLFRRAIAMEWAKLIYSNKSAGNMLRFFSSPLFSFKGLRYFIFLTGRTIKNKVGV
jgi:glycosyltransferase involved in cell wall biosynthesis